MFIYILECEHGKYYVGKTTNPDVRMENHMSGNGSEWTKIYKPIKLVELIPNCDPFDEDKFVKKYMAKYGIENIRGGSYSRIKLTDQEVQSLKNEISGATDTCFRCHRTGHWIQDCKETTNADGTVLQDPVTNKYAGYTGQICYKCGRKGHLVKSCYAKKHVNGRDIASDWNTCYRCGRQGHWLIACNQKTDLYGRPIPTDECILF